MKKAATQTVHQSLPLFLLRPTLSVWRRVRQPLDGTHWEDSRRAWRRRLDRSCRQEEGPTRSMALSSCTGNCVENQKAGRPRIIDGALRSQHDPGKALGKGHDLEPSRLRLGGANCHVPVRLPCASSSPSSSSSSSGQAIVGRECDAPPSRHGFADSQVRCFMKAERIPYRTVACRPEGRAE